MHTSFSSVDKEPRRATAVFGLLVTVVVALITGWSKISDEISRAEKNLDSEIQNVRGELSFRLRDHEGRMTQIERDFHAHEVLPFHQGSQSLKEDIKRIYAEIDSLSKRIESFQNSVSQDSRTLTSVMSSLLKELERMNSERDK